MKKLIAFALVAVSSLSMISMARADLVTNGSFESLDGTPGKDFFPNSKPTGWSGGDQSVTMIDAPGTADDDSTFYYVYGPFPSVSPDGGNFVQAEADTSFPDPIYQTINGLTAGQNYAVSFYEAAALTYGYEGPTTQQWKVSFGSQTQDSTFFNLPDQAVIPWQKKTLIFTADSTSQILSFLATGGPDGSPPMLFLDGVSVQDAPLPNAFLSTLLLVAGVATFQSVRSLGRGKRRVVSLI